MKPRYTSRMSLEKAWFVAADAEWIFWDSPLLKKVLGFQVVLKDLGLVLEWRHYRGFTTGTHDDGETPGRARKAPVVSGTGGRLSQARAEVLARLDRLEEGDPLPPDRRDLVRNLVETLDPGLPDSGSFQLTPEEQQAVAGASTAKASTGGAPTSGLHPRGGTRLASRLLPALALAAVVLLLLVVTSP